jgi:FKBP-type peptidyl-prolyl cis-trans isomerase (trigger factor)
MSFEIKETGNSEIEIIGEITAEEFDRCYAKALKEFSANITVPGFRQGNVPPNIVLERVGDKAVLERAGEIAIDMEFPKIVIERKLDVIGVPKASITKIAKSSPMGYKLNISVLPRLNLPENYREIAKKALSQKEEISVDKKEIDETLSQLRKMKTKDGEKEPELNDDFAKSVGNFEDLVALESAIKDNIKYEKETKAKERRRLGALEDILKKMSFEAPKVLIEGERKSMLHDFKASIADMGMKWEDYLSHIKKTEEEILKGWDGESLKRVRYGLLLRELANDMKIEIKEDEINAKISGIESQRGAVPAEEKEKMKDYFYGIMKNEKVFSSLEE